MQRSVRLTVLAVMCFVVAFFSMLSNVSELTAAVVGPSFVPAEDAPGTGMFAELMQAQHHALREALNQRGYRVLRGLESAAGLAMAAVLGTVGFGLITGRRWAVRLAVGWALYAIFAAVGSMLIDMHYLMPNLKAVTPMPRGTEWVAGVFSVVLLCAFPVFLLGVLGLPVMWKRLSSRRNPPPTHVTPPAAGQSYQPPVAAPEPVADRVPPTYSQAAPDRAQTWRDDPWNDPSPR